MIALDLYAGMGGWDLAATRLGIRPLGVENMPEALATREAIGFETAFEDVWDGLRNPSIVPEYEMLIGSPPCQRYSPAGNGEGRKNLDVVYATAHQMAWQPKLELHGMVDAGLISELDALVLVPLAYALRDRPTFIALEQVPAVLPVWEKYADILRDRGYSVATGNLHSEQFGVPQTRKRAILAARRDGREAKLPTPTYSKYYPRSPERLDEGVLPWVSMAEALGFGLADRPSPTITGGGTETGGAEPIAKLGRYVGRESWVLKGNQKPPGSATPSGYQERLTSAPAQTITGQASLYRFEPRPELAAWKWLHSPSTTVAGDPRVTAREHHYHGEQNSTSLRLTIEKAKILQSFPADFPVQGGKGKQFLQVGNAVPPLMAEAILKGLTEL